MISDDIYDVNRYVQNASHGAPVKDSWQRIKAALQQPQPQPCPHTELCDYYKKAKFFSDVIEQHQPQPASGAEMPDSADDLTIAYMAGAAAQRDKMEKEGAE
jgi:hypothetical protein